MRLSHRELEEAQRDPAAFLRERMRGQQYGGKPSAFRLWQLSVSVLHRDRADLATARQYLEDAFRRNYVSGLVQERRLRLFVEHLERYAEAVAATNHTVISTRTQIRWSLAPHIDLRGEISRIDLSPTGYSLCLLLRSRPPRWRDELRMPVLQHLVASRLGVAAGVVETGVYDLDTGTHDWHSFSDGDIATALERASVVAENISVAAGRVGFSLQ